MKNFANLLWAWTLLAIVTAHFGTPAQAREETPETWFSEGQRAVQEAKQHQPKTARAKNIILFVGDGMGISTITAARILDGQLRGENGEENSLSFKKLPYSALSKTYSVNQQVPDSAPTMTAMVTGVKTKDAMILSVNALSVETINLSQEMSFPPFWKSPNTRENRWVSSLRHASPTLRQRRVMRTAPSAIGNPTPKCRAKRAPQTFLTSRGN